MREGSTILNATDTATPPGSLCAYAAALWILGERACAGLKFPARGGTWPRRRGLVCSRKDSCLPSSNIGDVPCRSTTMDVRGGFLRGAGVPSAPARAHCGQPVDSPGQSSYSWLRHVSYRLQLAGRVDHRGWNIWWSSGSGSARQRRGEPPSVLATFIIGVLPLLPFAEAG